MKYIFFAFSITALQAFSAVPYVGENTLTFDGIMADIDGPQSLNKDSLLEFLNFNLKKGDATASHILAYIYYTGSYGTEIDIERAISLLSLPVEEGIPDAKHLLGTILATHDGADNLSRGISLLESASEDGITDSSVNLYALYQKGKYSNVEFLSRSLKEASEQGDFMAAVYWGHVILDRSVSQKDHALLSDAVSYLQERFKSGEYTREDRRDIYYLFVGIYGLPDSPLYDEFLRDFYMKRASENGHPMAEEFVREYLD